MADIKALFNDIFTCSAVTFLLKNANGKYIFHTQKKEIASVLSYCDFKNSKLYNMRL